MRAKRAKEDDESLIRKGFQALHKKLEFQIISAFSVLKIFFGGWNRDDSVLSLELDGDDDAFFLEEFGMELIERKFQESVIFHKTMFLGSTFEIEYSDFNESTMYLLVNQEQPARRVKVRMIETEHSNESGVDFGVFEKRREINIVIRLDKRHLDSYQGRKHLDYKYLLLSRYLLSKLNNIDPNLLQQLYVLLGPDLRRNIDRRRRVMVLLSIVVTYLIENTCIIEQDGLIKVVPIEDYHEVIDIKNHFLEKKKMIDKAIDNKLTDFWDGAKERFTPVNYINNIDTSGDQLRGRRFSRNERKFQTKYMDSSLQDLQAGITPLKSRNLGLERSSIYQINNLDSGVEGGMSIIDEPSILEDLISGEQSGNNKQCKQVDYSNFKWPVKMQEKNESMYSFSENDGLPLRYLFKLIEDPSFSKFDQFYHKYMFRKGIQQTKVQNMFNFRTVTRESLLQERFGFQKGKNLLISPRNVLNPISTSIINSKRMGSPDFTITGINYIRSHLFAITLKQDKNIFASIRFFLNLKALKPPWSVLCVGHVKSTGHLRFDQARIIHLEHLLSPEYVNEIVEYYLMYSKLRSSDHKEIISTIYKKLIVQEGQIRIKKSGIILASFSKSKIDNFTNKNMSKKQLRMTRLRSVRRRISSKNTFIKMFQSKRTINEVIPQKRNSLMTFLTPNRYIGNPKLIQTSDINGNINDKEEEGNDDDQMNPIISENSNISSFIYEDLDQDDLAEYDEYNQSIDRSSLLLEKPLLYHYQPQGNEEVDLNFEGKKNYIFRNGLDDVLHVHIKWVYDKRSKYLEVKTYRPLCHQFAKFEISNQATIRMVERALTKENGTTETHIIQSLFSRRVSILGAVYKDTERKRTIRKMISVKLSRMGRLAFRPDAMDTLKKQFAHHEFTLLFADEKKRKYAVKTNVFFSFNEQTSGFPRVLVYFDFYPLRKRVIMYRLVLNEQDIMHSVNKDILYHIRSRKITIKKLRQVLKMVRFRVDKRYPKPCLVGSDFKQMGYEYFLSNKLNIDEKEEGYLLQKTIVDKKLVGHFTKQLDGVYTLFSVFQHTKRNELLIEIYVPLSKRRFKATMTFLDINRLDGTFWSSIYYSNYHELMNEVNSSKTYQDLMIRVKQVSIKTTHTFILLFSILKFINPTTIEKERVVGPYSLPILPEKNFLCIQRCLL